MMRVFSIVAGSFFGCVLWVKCAIIGGGEFLGCPVRPVVVASMIMVAIAWCFRDAVREHPFFAASFFAAAGMPFGIHSLFALF